MSKICILTASVSYWSQIIKFSPVQVREICVDFKDPSSVGSNKFLSRYTLKFDVDLNNGVSSMKKCYCMFD